MDLKKISKLMSLVLRHKPEVLNIKVDKKGWTDFNILIEQIQIKHPEVTRDNYGYWFKKDESHTRSFEWRHRDR